MVTMQAVSRLTVPAHWSGTMDAVLGGRNSLFDDDEEFVRTLALRVEWLYQVVPNPHQGDAVRVV
jgi:hypothetical protein